MDQHPITLEQLADWLDGRLDAEARQTVAAHLTAGCPDCQAELAWLRRFTAAARAPALPEPPEHLVRQIKTRFRPQQAPRRVVLSWSWQWAAAMAALLILVVSVSAFIARSPSLIARQAQLSLASGRAETRGISDTWRPLQDGATLRQGDHLRVTEGSARLTLFDGSILELQPGSEIALASLRSSLWGAACQVDIAQGKGAVRYDVAKLRSGRSTFRVQSPVAQVSVQGTSFWVTILDEQQTEIAVLEGRVKVIGAADSVSLDQNQTVLAAADAPLRLAPTLLQTTSPTLALQTTPDAEGRTLTPTASPSGVTRTRTPSATSPGQRTATGIMALTATDTPTVVAVSATASASHTVTGTASPETHTPTATGSAAIWTPTGTASATATLMTTRTPSISVTPTPSPSGSATSTATWTPVPLPTDTPIPIATDTPAPTSTPLPSATYTPLATETAQPTDTLLPLATYTPLPTEASQPSNTPSPIWTDTLTPVSSSTSAFTATPFPSQTNTPPPSATRTSTVAATATRTPSSHTITVQQGVDGYNGCRDVGVSIWEPDKNFEWAANDQTNDRIEIRTNDNVAALLRFDLASIPANATVTSAILSLYVWDRFGTRAMTVGAYEVYRSWVAAEATWNQAAAGQRWAAAGCNGLGSDRSADAAASVAMNATRTWYELSLAGLAQKWVSSPAANHGLALKAWGDSAGYRVVTSEHGGVWMHPKLTISYLLPN